MNYAAQYHIGNRECSRTAKAATVTPPAGSVRPLDAKHKRCERGAKGQPKISPHIASANGFLNSTFLPKLKSQETTEAGLDVGKAEKNIYGSLRRLAEHYGFEPMQTQFLGFPYNIAVSMWDTQNKLQRTASNWDNLRLVQKGKKIFFVSEERYRMGTTLYYIPVNPLFQMLHDPCRRKTAVLLTSVCAYLYHIADIPYYRQEHSYLNWHYEMLADWVEQDEETDETEIYRSEFREAEWIGDHIEQKLFNRDSLNFLGQRLRAFQPKDEFDRKCKILAADGLALYTEYPNESVFRNAPQHGEDTENDCGEPESIGMEKYISFMADTKGWLYHNLCECINNEFGEYGEIDEPSVIKLFDGSKLVQGNLFFEARLFTLINDLCDLLDTYNTTRR